MAQANILSAIWQSYFQFHVRRYIEHWLVILVTNNAENLVPITAEDHTSNNIPSTILENHSHIYELE